METVIETVIVVVADSGETSVVVVFCETSYCFMFGVLFQLLHKMSGQSTEQPRFD